MEEYVINFGVRLPFEDKINLEMESRKSKKTKQNHHVQFSER